MLSTPIVFNPKKKKVDLVGSFSPLTNVYEVMGFIGMRIYYQGFVPQFFNIADPITALTQKYAKFVWASNCEKSLEIIETIEAEL